MNFVPWTDRPEDRFSGRLEWYDSALSRITYQASQDNKINFTYDEQRACNCGTSVARAQEASAGYRFDPNRLLQFTWTSTQTSRLLLEAGGTAAISQWNSFSLPALRRDRARDVGIYAQDQWTIDRLTVNLGVRFDKLCGFSPAQEAPDEPSEPGAWQGSLRINEWLGARSFAATERAPDWNDISPRVGFAYDLFGTGRTAIKASLGRYVAKIGNELTQANNPVVRSIESTNRSWADANGGYIPDCDLGNFGANGECGAIDNTNFGQNNPNATRWDESILTGLRDSNWDLTTELQQELMDGLSVTVGYYWNNSGYNQENNSQNRVTDNAPVGAGGLRRVLRHGPGGSATARRRRLRGLWSL